MKVEIAPLFTLSQHTLAQSIKQLFFIKVLEVCVTSETMIVYSAQLFSKHFDCSCIFITPLRQHKGHMTRRTHSSRRCDGEFLTEEMGKPALNCFYKSLHEEGVQCFEVFFVLR